ncbi:MAG: hypothetical protein M1609_14475 [Firmicutes bacterium]|nr:hypothetical protein [Bacillota bacterium]
MEDTRERRTYGPFIEKIRGKEIEVTITLIKDPEAVRRGLMKLVEAEERRLAREQSQKTTSDE